MFNKVVLTMLSILVYLYQQTVIISPVQSFKGYTSGLSLDIDWVFRLIMLPHYPPSLEEHILMH